MTMTQHITTCTDIDWQLLWEQSRSRKSWKSKNAGEWDRKAASFADRMKDSAYAGRFLQHVSLDKTMHVLDVGCGPGTLALPIAEQVARVTAIDYSRTMLELLDRQSDQAGIDNIRSVQCSWEDDWSEHDITTYDLVIASRSLNIRNLAGALQKLDNHCRGSVFVAERIDPSPFDVDAFTAIGRPFNSGPDYIYTVNMLYRFGIHPRMELIELDRELRYNSFEDALNAYKWMFKELEPREEKLLEAFLETRIVTKEKDHIVVRRDPPQRWALLSWNHSDARVRRKTDTHG